MGLAQEKPRPTTFTYKKVGPLEIKADVFRAPDHQVRPVVVIIHGGALINGSRSGGDSRLAESLLHAGYAAVSIDYRLAPETKLPDLVQDVEDAIAWVYREGPRLFYVDTSKIAVTGSSAGGYLTLTAGFRAKPRPAVLVSFWGYGDLLGEWLTKPSRYPRHYQIVMKEEEAYRQVSGTPISAAQDRKGDGSAFSRFCRQHGLWPEAVSGWNPHSEPEKFYPYMPYRNVTDDFPPTLLIHGTNDTDVPYEQSLLMSVELKKHGIPYELIPVCGSEHGFGDKSPEVVSSLYRSMIEFLDRYMKNPK